MLWPRGKSTNFSKSWGFGKVFHSRYVTSCSKSIPRDLFFLFFFFLCFFFLFRPQGPPCTIILFTVPYHGKASCTQCLPIDQRLTRNSLEESILEEVDGLEESSIAAIGICAFETIIVLSLLGASCVKRFEKPRLASVHDTRTTPRRIPVFEESISAIR